MLNDIKRIQNLIEERNKLIETANKCGMSQLLLTIPVDVEEVKKDIESLKLAEKIFSLLH